MRERKNNKQKKGFIALLLEHFMYEKNIMKDKYYESYIVSSALQSSEGRLCFLQLASVSAGAAVEASSDALVAASARAEDAAESAACNKEIRAI